MKGLGDKRDLDRERARFVYEQLRRAPWLHRKDEVARIKGLPIALRRQGLAVTTADCIRRKNNHGDADRAVLTMLVEWLFERMPGSPLGGWAESGNASPGTLLDAVSTVPRPTYIAIQREALALVGHIKIYADALHEIPEGA